MDLTPDPSLLAYTESEGESVRMHEPSDDGQQTQKPATSKVAERALDVLLCLIDAEVELGVTEIARRVGIEKSRVHRFLVALKRKGFVVANPRTRRYSLGYRAFALSKGITQILDLGHQAAPYLQELRDDIGETIGLVVRVGPQRVVVAQAESRQEIRQTFPLFEPLPLHRGAAGKALLAFLSADDHESAIESAIASGPPLSPQQVDVLRQELDRVRQQGWAQSLGERIANSRSIAAPVWTWRGDVVALVCSAPRERFTEDAARAAVPSLLAMAARLTRRMHGDEHAAKADHGKVSS
jgi:IclR family transcriptional regulator, KDG regulon repressor